MRKSFIKRFTAALLIVVIALSLSACSGNEQSNDASTDVKGEQNKTTENDNEKSNSSGKVFDKPTKLSIMIGSHASWPYDPEWKMWQYVKEATGAELDITAVPSAELSTKVNLIMASKDQLPDLLHMYSKAIPDKHALSGAFVSILDNIDKLPNFKKWMDTTPEAEEYTTQRTSGDGKVYFFPTYGLHTINNMRSWIYRKDIFEKHGLQPPKDTDEMYEVAKKLKEIYPDSYPVSFRLGIGQFQIMGPQWKSNFEVHGYYDFQNEKWCYGAIEDTMKEMVIYHKKLYDEGLVAPDFLTITSQSWQQLISSNRGFMMPEYIVRIDFFNQPARKQNPDYTWAVMEPPKASISTGTHKLTKTNFEFSGYLVCNTGKKENINNAFKFVDWMYSDEGIELLSWGKEGETYKVENGEKKFILDDKGTPARNLYGVGTLGLYQVVDPASNEALYTKENVQNARKALEYLEERANPKHWLPMNDDEIDFVTQTLDAVAVYAEQEISKFILGQRPISEWNDYVNEVKKLGVDELLATYEKAYKRVMSKK